MKKNCSRSTNSPSATGSAVLKVIGAARAESGKLAIPTIQMALSALR